MKARIPKSNAMPNNMQALAAQAQKMQDEITNKQAEIDLMEFSSSSGGGVVEVSITGKKEVKSIKIKPEIVNPDDIEMLEDLVMSAINEAIRLVEEKTNQEMDKITSGLNVPGLF